MSEDKILLDVMVKEKAKIKDWLLKDRLSHMSKLFFMNNFIFGSVTGWDVYFKSAMIMDKFTEEELTVLTSKFEKLTLEFLELDAEYAKLMINKNKKQLADSEIDDIEDEEELCKEYVKDSYRRYIT